MPMTIAKESWFKTLEESFESIFSNLFSLSGEEKMRHFNIGRRGLTGYFPLDYEVTHSDFGAENKEYWQLCRMGDFADGESDLYPRNAWPVSQSSAFDILSELYLRLDTTVSRLLNLYCQEFDIPHDYVRFSSGNNILRLVHYPPGEQDAVPGHDDSTLFTLSLWESCSGMEVLANNGSWKNAGANTEEIFVLEGALLDRISGGRIPATIHKVRAPGTRQSRYSLLYFVHPPLNFLVRSMPDQEGRISPDILCRKFLGAHIADLGINKPVSFQ